MIDFKVPRSKDKVLIDTKKWIQNSSGLSIHRMSGRDLPTYIATVLSENIENERLKGTIKEGDTVLLTRVVSDISMSSSFSVGLEGSNYYNVPIMQVLGVFEGNEVSFSTLHMIFDKVLIKKIETSGSLILPDDQTMIGEIVKTGTCKFSKDWDVLPLPVKVGDKVLLRDNICTEVFLNGEYYYAAEVSMIVGIFQDEEFTLEKADIISESIVMREYIPERALSSSLLTPLMNFEDADLTDIYNRDLFKVVAVDKNLTKIKKDDILLLDRNVANYVYYRENKYFILNGTDYVEAKIEEGKE